VFIYKYAPMAKPFAVEGSKGLIINIMVLQQPHFSGYPVCQGGATTVAFRDPTVMPTISGRWCPAFCFFILLHNNQKKKKKKKRPYDIRTIDIEERIFRWSISK
jgi:hypothetical protein